MKNRILRSSQKADKGLSWRREGETSEYLHGCASLNIHFLPFLRCLPFTPRGYSECHNPPSKGKTESLSTWNLPRVCETVIVKGSSGLERPGWIYIEDSQELKGQGMGRNTGLFWV